MSAHCVKRAHGLAAAGCRQLFYAATPVSARRVTIAAERRARLFLLRQHARRETADKRGQVEDEGCRRHLAGTKRH
eukprot:6198228-Pleurochrysis_carterae.AAC.2